MHVVVCIWITPVFLSTIGLTPVLHSHHKFLLISLFTSQTPDGAYAMTTTGRGGGGGGLGLIHFRPCSFCPPGTLSRDAGGTDKNLFI